MASACHILTPEYSVEERQFRDRLDYIWYILASTIIFVQMASIFGPYGYENFKKDRSWYLNTLTIAVKLHYSRAKIGFSHYVVPHVSIDVFSYRVAGA
jgi:hypothetical protein